MKGTTLIIFIKFFDSCTPRKHVEDQAVTAVITLTQVKKRILQQLRKGTLNVYGYYLIKGDNFMTSCLLPWMINLCKRGS